MSAAVLALHAPAAGGVFDLGSREAWLRWRDAKLAVRARDAAALVVEVRHARDLTDAEVAAIVARCRRTNMAIYASRTIAAGDDEDVTARVAARLGLASRDANPLAPADGVARIAVDAARAAAGYIPYTARRMRWHTDGYYNPAGRPVRAMILHCVRAAAAGGETALLDPELAWLLLREADESLVAALMQPDALTIPAAPGRDAVAGPVFALDPGTGDLRMRYTARRRSVRWKPDAVVAQAAARLLALMDHDATCVLRTRLEPGMGLVCNNVLHERAAFEDDAASPRLVLRARYAERIAGTRGAWRRLAGRGAR